MVTVCELNKCNGCMACVDKCPKKCISMIDNIYAYNADRNMDICINCGLCEKVCPNNSPAQLTESIDWKQGWAEQNIRKRASSGGAASAIMKAFIESGGYVASCLFRNGQFIFDITNDLETAKQFTGSKYIKSNPVGIYQKIQNQLKTDKVLFIGLPCQVAGLKNFIGNQENLYTIDLICHGTPSPKILEQFLHEQGYELKELKNIGFRNKTEFGLSAEGISRLEKRRDSYLISFLNGVDYTENCYSCQFATKNRVADITLGDSWGTELKSEEGKGISLILIQSERGRMLAYSSGLELKNVVYENALKANHQLNYPSVHKPERETFIHMITNGNTVRQAVKKTLPKEVMKQKVKYILTQMGILRKHGQ